MYRWYQRSKVCYVYLVDCYNHGKDSSDYGQSRWFTRGWTLQELIAPSNVEFYTASWDFIGSKSTLHYELASITNIWSDVLRTCDPFKAPIAARMSWASKRQTTREEDMAYCLMGIFDVNMPLLYGEGDKAFLRLQQQIAAESTDHTLFAWNMTLPNGIQDYQMSLSYYSGLFARSPAEFQPDLDEPIAEYTLLPAEISTQTNRGYHLILPLLPADLARDFATDDYKSLTFKSNEYVALLNCRFSRVSPGGRWRVGGTVGLVLTKLEERLDGKDGFARIGRFMHFNNHRFLQSRSALDFQKHIWISQHRVFPNPVGLQRIAGIKIGSIPEMKLHAVHTRFSFSEAQLISFPPESVTTQGVIVAVFVFTNIIKWPNLHVPLNVIVGFPPDSESPIIALKFANMDSPLEFDLETLDIAEEAKGTHHASIYPLGHIFAKLKPILINGQLIGEIEMYTVL